MQITHALVLEHILLKSNTKTLYQTSKSRPTLKPDIKQQLRTQNGPFLLFKLFLQALTIL